MENNLTNNKRQKNMSNGMANLSAEDILIWLEQSSQFVRQFLSNEDILRWRKIKDEPVVKQL